MPKAYTLTPRPKNLSTAATLIHRLRHPLRIQRVRHPSLLPTSSGSVRTESDKRRPRVEDEWLEAPTSHGSPYELVEIEDKGAYTEQRYGNVNVYWNSVMVEASEEEKQRRREAGEKNRKQKRQGRIFGDTEQLYKAHDSRQRTQDRVQFSTAASQQTRSLPKSPSANPTLSDRIQESYLPTPLDHDDADRYITLTENPSVTDLNMHSSTDTDLTWNSALTRILASPCVDSSVSSTIRARARGRRLSRNPEEVDMREVSMVPNFSYPIASAQWSDASAPSDRAFLDSDGCGHKVGGVGSGEPRPVASSALVNDDDDISFLDLECSNNGDDDSLYRAPTPALLKRGTSESDSVLRDVLDPDELEMYREIVRHNPRFTVLLDQDDRQVPLVAKLSAVIEVLRERRADFEGCETCHGLKMRAGGYEHLRPALMKRKEDVVDLKRAVDFSSRVLDGCWKRECSMLNTLLDIEQRKQEHGIVLTRWLARENDAILDDNIRQHNGGSKTAGLKTGPDASLSRKELDALIYTAALNVRILREDAGDLVELLRKVKE